MKRPHAFVRPGRCHRRRRRGLVLLLSRYSSLRGEGPEMIMIPQVQTRWGIAPQMTNHSINLRSCIIPQTPRHSYPLRPVVTLLIPACTPRSPIREEGKAAPRSFRAHHSPGVLDPISQRSNCGTAVAARNAGHHGPGAITPRLIQFTIPLPFIPFCVVRTLDTPLVFSIQPFHFHGPRV